MVKCQIFSDVGYKYLWAMDAIDGFYEKGIVKGDQRGMFNPGDNTKRGDFIIMVVNALELEAQYNENFSDVKKDSYYYDAIAIAKELGIIKGVREGVFNPDGNITREDMMVIVTKALEVSEIELEKPNLDDLLEYNDANEISGYAKEAVATLTGAGLVKGFGGGVHPKRMATRAEIVVILNLLLESI